MTLPSRATRSPSVLVIGIAVVAILYLGLRIPLLVSDIPNWYHAYVESNTFEVAHSMAVHGHPNDQPHPSVAGYNLHGILATPVYLLHLDPRLVRLVTLTAGAIGILFVWKTQALLGSSLRAKIATAALLAVTPHFVLLSGFAMPQSVTAMFGAISIYYYLRWRMHGQATLHATLSALFAGLAAFNHFSGLVVAMTIAALFLLDVVRTRSWPVSRKPALTLAAVFAVGSLPAVLLWYSRSSRGLLELYEKYGINHSGDMLLTVDWWRTQLHYAAEYQPVFYLIGLAALYMVATALLRRRAFAGPLQEAGPINPAYFWGIWFVIGLLQIPLFPGGSFIHEYYVWWAILPSAPLFVTLLEMLWRGKQTAQVTVVAVVLVASTVIASAQVSRAFGVTDIPVLCAYQDC